MSEPQRDTIFALFAGRGPAAIAIDAHFRTVLVRLADEAQK